MVTDMEGHFLKGYRISSGVPVAQFTARLAETSDGAANRMAKLTSPTHGECTPNTDCVICIQELDEILIVSNDRDTNTGGGNANYFPIMDIYYGGSNGPLSAIQNTELEWDYGSRGGGNSGYNGDNEKEVWDCGRGNKVYNPRTRTCECPDAMVDNGYECVVEEVVIINNLTGKAKCVYEKLEKSNSKLFQETIGKFIDDPRYNLIFKNGKCNLGGTAGCTNSQEISLTGNVVITIEQLSGSVLENAAMILHEGIHAEIARYVQRHTTGEDPNNRARMFQLYKFYKESGVPSHHLDHPYMTLNYINPIASALRQLDGNKYPLDYYKSFAWDGLRNWDVSSLLAIEQSVEFEKYRKIVESNTSLSCD
ncbi:hypothetical protein [Gelidibacter pelagius]|uniref:SprT-like family protein n=1 Tax=Gelidibacter pelagius TaxID=2819985 RepID=A0ABS3SM07_9FLAO|nr:hypothetical protein [Gelidibacter pelagius]MBO3096664.1 hypothetical protein [Gelidibacter pelagius]